MATVKYSGPIASFRCPTNAEIRSLKVHFSPKQEGTGDPSPENVRPIVGWDGVEVYDCSKPYASTIAIPDEYKKVEYLESTGTQYIYTNVPGRSGVECKAKVSWVEGGASDACIFGARKYASDRIMLIHQYPLQKWTIGNGDSYTGLSRIDYDVPYFVEAKTAIGEQYLKINGNAIYTGTDATEYINNFNLSIFACTRESENNVTLFAKARVYYLVASVNDNVVLNAVPCIRKSDNKPGLYDTVSSTFLTNAGTGEFLCGPEIVGYSTNYEFGVLGKNKLPITFNMEIKSINTGYNNSLQRDMTPGILYPNVSANNYWLGTSAKTFVQEVQNGSITFKANDGSYGIGTIVPVQPQATYTISYTTSDNQVRIRIGCYNADGYFTGTHQVINNGASFTVPNDTYHVIIVATPNSDYYNQSITVSNLQLELGSTATEYEPYDPNHTVYGGWLDLISGEVCEEWHKIVADGVNVKANSAYNQPDYNRFGAGIVYCSPIGVSYNNTEKPVKCDILPVNPNGYGSLADIDQLYAPWVGQLYVVFYVGKISEHPEITTSDQRKEFTNAWLQEHPTTILYKLRTPETYHISPTQLQTFLGHNNVWSNADYVEVEYDLHETQDILARKQFIIANQPHVESKIGSVVHFNTDLSSQLKSFAVNFLPNQLGVGTPGIDNVRPISCWDSFNIYHLKDVLEPYYAITASNKVSSGVTYSTDTYGKINAYGIPTSSSTIDSARYNVDGDEILYSRIVGDCTNVTNNRPLMFDSSGKSIGPTPSDNILSSGLNLNSYSGTEYIVTSIKRNINGVLVSGSCYLAIAKNAAPYLETSTIDLSSLEIPLCGGIVDLVNGTVTYTYFLYETTWGERTINVGSLTNTDYGGFRLPYTAMRDSAGIIKNKKCNVAPWVWKWTELDEPHWYGGGNIAYLFVPKGTDDSTVVQFTLPLAEPIVVGIDPVIIKSFRGHNTFVADNNGDIEVKYWTH